MKLRVRGGECERETEPNVRCPRRRQSEECAVQKAIPSEDEIPEGIEKRGAKTRKIQEERERERQRARKRASKEPE